MNIHVSTPSVEQSVSAFISAALIGSTSDPNARNIRIVVMDTAMRIICGSFAEIVATLSCSSAGVPPTNRFRSCGFGIALSASTFALASSRFSNPF